MVLFIYYTYTKVGEVGVVGLKIQKLGQKQRFMKKRFCQEFGKWGFNLLPPLPPLPHSPSSLIPPPRPSALALPRLPSISPSTIE